MMAFAENQAKELSLSLDKRLLNHLGLIFKGDPLVVYSDRIYVDNSTNTNHFENLQSTNWNNARFKPPPSFDSDVGWRVELRTMEAQLAPQESTALSMLAYLFVDMVMKKEYNFYIPLSKVHENMERAHKRDAILKEKFWFRQNMEKDSEDKWVELTLDEILHGKTETFIGLYNLIYQFCKEEYGVDMRAEWIKKKEGSQAQTSVISDNMEYFEILSQRVKGERPTIAHWIREFVLRHPKYQKDSVVSAEIAADLVAAMNEISDNKKTYSDFF